MKREKHGEFFFAKFIQSLPKFLLKFQQSLPYTRRSQVIDKSPVHIHYSLLIHISIISSLEHHIIQGYKHIIPNIHPLKLNIN
jgi:hypothetical protein